MLVCLKLFRLKNYHSWSQGNEVTARTTRIYNGFFLTTKLMETNTSSRSHQISLLDGFMVTLQKQSVHNPLNGSSLVKKNNLGRIRSNFHKDVSKYVMQCFICRFQKRIHLNCYYLKDNIITSLRQCIFYVSSVYLLLYKSNQRTIRISIRMPTVNFSLKISANVCCMR